MKLSKQDKKLIEQGESVSAIVFRAIAQNFITEAVEFKKKLDKAVNQHHGGGNGKRLLMQLQREFDKVVKIEGEEIK